jgi:hypothetical protein
MVRNAFKTLWHAATGAKRWIMIAQALDILSEAYETQTAIPATAMLTPDGIFIEIELDEVVVELLEPDDIAELSPKAYAMLLKARAFDVKDVMIIKEAK